MGIAEEVLRKVRALAPDKQIRVLQFVDTLQAEQSPGAHRRSLRGLWRDMGFGVTEKDIADARREMWGDFPRDIGQSRRDAPL